MVQNETSVHFLNFAEHIVARLRSITSKLANVLQECQECKVLYAMISTDFPPTCLCQKLIMKNREKVHFSAIRNEMQHLSSSK